MNFKVELSGFFLDFVTLWNLVTVVLMFRAIFSFHSYTVYMRIEVGFVGFIFTKKYFLQLCFVLTTVTFLYVIQ